MTLDSSFLIYLAEWLGVVAVTMILSLSPRFTRRPVRFVYPRRDGLFALAIFTVALIIAFAFYNSINVNPARIVESGGEIAGWGQRISAAVLGLVGAACLLFLRRQPLLSTGWGKANFRPSIQMGLGFIIITLFLRGRFMELFGGVSTAQGIALLIFAGLTLAEETLFRGYIQLRLSSWLGENLGIFATSVMYVIWQLPGRIGLIPFSEIWSLLLFSAVQGLVCGYIMQKSGHILAPTMYRWVSGWLMFF